MGGKLMKDNTRAEGLVLEHLDLVSEVLKGLKTVRYYPDQAGLISAGNLGLVKAAQSYSPHKGVPFRPYAFLAIQREIIDEVRTNYPGKNRARVRLAKRLVVEDTLLNCGDDITLELLALKLQIPEDEARKWVQETTPNSLLSIDRETENSSGLLDRYTSPSAEDEYLRREIIELVRRGVTQLPYPYLKPIILATFYEGRTQRDIANELGLNMGNIHVYVRQAKDHLRRFLIQEYYKVEIMP